MRDGGLPDGARLHRFAIHRDERGAFTEVFRDEWETGVQPVQWNVVSSEAGVLRGVHVHARHDDYLSVVSGRAVVGLVDLRPDSPTAGRSTTFELRGDAMSAITIPHGVAHGFLFTEPSVHVYAVSHTFDPSDELGCRWDDPGLGIDWPMAPTLLSDRDRDAGTLAELRSVMGAPF